MQPTNKLRFIERKYKMSDFYRDTSGGPAYTTMPILQQWWEHTEQGDDGPLYCGEWRDVPTEVESE